MKSIFDCRLLTVACFFVLPTTTWAGSNVEEEGDTAGIVVDSWRLGMLMQARHTDTRPNNGTNIERQTLQADDGYSVRRARFELVARPLETIRGEIYYDFVDSGSNNKSALKNAFIEFTPMEQVSFTAGRFKVPFSLMHLRSVAKLEVAENGPTDDLLVDLGFAGFDLGLMTTLEPLEKKRWLRISAGAFGGGGVHESASPVGMVAGRVTSAVWKHFDLGIGGAYRPQKTGDPSQPNAKKPERDRYAGRVFGADARFTWDGVHAQFEMVRGDRVDWWRQNARTFLGMTAMASYHIDLNEIRLAPVVKYERLDTDLEFNEGREQLFTAGFNIYYSVLRLLVQADRIHVQRGSLNVSPKHLGETRRGGFRSFVQLQLDI